jgi:hypothetical protein
VRRSALLIAMVAGALVLGGCATTGVGVGVGAGVSAGAQRPLFYDELSPYGRWMWVPPYGWTWAPMGVGAGWRPFGAGRWMMADGFGWSFYSPEPWGSSVYRYGRWAFMNDVGWVWVPGGPARYQPTNRGFVRVPDPRDRVVHRPPREAVPVAPGAVAQPLPPTGRGMDARRDNEMARARAQNEARAQARERQIERSRQDARSRAMDDARRRAHEQRRRE